MGFSIKGDKLTKRDLDGLFNEYYPRVYNYIYYRTLNAALADDMVGNVMLNIVKAHGSFDATKGNLDAWVFRIARNALFSHFRKTRDVVDVDSVSETVFSYEDEQDDLDERGNMVRDMLKVLNDEERELVYLKFWEELSNKEIAARMGMNASTVSTKLWRANEKMRKTQQ
ncbi:MAG: sigma-70 family RNA polymerase sigma factor [Atopobiaceae bacterium]|nr:sigma-70 family RNA polymerase sigma factor [Atopobiaceae bacterium]